MATEKPKIEWERDDDIPHGFIDLGPGIIEIEREPHEELVYLHFKTWIEVTPLSKDEAAKRLEEIKKEYIAAIEVAFEAAVDLADRDLDIQYDPDDDIDYDPAEEILNAE